MVWQKARHTEQRVVARTHTKSDSKYYYDRFWGKLAVEIHTLLDIPLTSTRRASTGVLIINTIRLAMISALQRGEHITLRGFGEFRIVNRPPETSGKRGNIIVGRPFTLSPEPMTYPSRKKVIFKPGYTLRGLVDNGPNAKVRKHMRRWAPKESSK